MLGLATFWNVQDVVSYIEAVNIGMVIKILLKLVFEKKFIMFGQGYVQLSLYFNYKQLKILV